MSIDPTFLSRRAYAILLALAPIACVSLPAPPPGLAAATPAFLPERFFVGHLQGDGTVAIIARRSHPVTVRSEGHREPDGTIVLVQLVRESGEPPKRRTWRIRRIAPGRYAGSLSDAAGPVTGTLSGNALFLTFRMRGGLDVEQRLYLRPDGRTAINRMTVRKFGVLVGTLTETIRKLD